MNLKKIWKSMLLCGALLLLIILCACSAGDHPDGSQDTTDSGGTVDTGSGDGEETLSPDIESVEADPYGTILNAIQNAGAEFFADDAGLFDVVQKTMQQGSVALSFAHETLLGDIKRINETFYVDSNAQKYVSKTQVLIDRKLLAAYLFFDREGLTLKCNSVLGNDRALELNLAEFFTSFGDSAAADLSGLSAEMLDMIVGGSGLVGELYQMLFEEDPAAAKELLSVLGEIFSEQIRSTGDGYLLSYEIDNEALLELSERVNAHLSEMGSEAVFTEQIVSLLASYTVALRVDLLIDQKTMAMKRMLLQGGLTPLEEGKPVDVSFAWRCYEDQMKLSAAITLDQHISSVELTLNKLIEGAVTSYTVSLDGTFDGNERHLLDAKYLYDVGGGVKITGTLYDERNEPIDLVLLGQITVGETEGSIVFTSLQYKNLIVKFDASVTFTPNVDLPEKPENAVDVVQMTEEEWQTVVKNLKESVFGDLIFGGSGSDGKTE